MDLKIPSAIVERQIFPKHTNRTEMGSGGEAIVAVVAHVLVGYLEEAMRNWISVRQGARPRSRSN